MRTVVLSHGRPSGGGSDLDAVASVACAVRALGPVLEGAIEFDFVDYIPDRLDRLVARDDRESRLVLADIPLEALCRGYEPGGSVADVLSELHGRGNRLVLIDHHPLPEQDLALYRDLEERGVLEELRLALPPVKRPATELVLDYLSDHGLSGEDSVLETLGRYARDQDFAHRSIPEANRLTDVIVGRYDLVRLVEKLVDGHLWDEELEAFLRETEERTRKLLEGLQGERRLLGGAGVEVTYALLPEGLKTTPASEFLFDRDPEVGVVILFKPDRIALRRRFGDDRVDLGEFAFGNGGGGHPGASVVHGNRCDLFELSGIDATNFSHYVERFHAQLDSFASEE